MCGTCGCDDHVPASVPAVGAVRDLHEAILAKNDALASRNRRFFHDEGVLALNLVSSPGAGKTTLLERTIREVSGRFPICVIEGDQETDSDAQRIREAGARAVQINTGVGCHLDASMVARGLGELEPRGGSVVMIENVGNLVCPALFDLGEAAKVVIASVTEGEDKPLKYPHMFRASSLMLVNKIDLLPHLAFDVQKLIDCARRVNPKISVLMVSAKSGEGMTDWYAWIEAAVKRAGEHVHVHEHQHAHALAAHAHAHAHAHEHGHRHEDERDHERGHG